jgi:hypothetical protein
LVMHIFCASATFWLGISMARSPRATITPSVTCVPRQQRQYRQAGC